MPRPFILLTPADGGLWRLARAIARQPARGGSALGGSESEPLDFAGLAQILCAREARKAEVNIAQMSEILSVVQRLLAADPKAVLEVLAGKIGE